MGASSFAPSPITTTPSIATVSSIRRIASTAAWSALSFWPLPIHLPAASAAASVTRTSSIARLRSGAVLGVGNGSASLMSVPFVRFPCARSVRLDASALQAVEEASRRGRLEEDPMDLRVEGEVQAQLAGEAVDLARRLDPLDGQSLRDQVGEGVLRVRTLADELAVEAVPPAEGDHEPFELVDGLREQGGLRVAIALVRDLAEPVHDAHPDRADVLRDRAVLHAGDVIGGHHPELGRAERVRGGLS